MTDQPSQADYIVGLWPGENLVEKRRALAASLGHPDDEKVRYWQKRGEIPQAYWQSIIDAGARDRIRVRPTDFVRHLRVPSKTPAAAAAG
jgi:hypothetical protein